MNLELAKHLLKIQNVPHLKGISGHTEFDVLLEKAIPQAVPSIFINNANLTDHDN